MSTEKFQLKILVPIDGSTSSIMAEETAAEIAKKMDATITVLNVAQELKVAYPIPKDVENEIFGRIEQESEKIVNDALALFREEGLKANSIKSKSSDPAENILELCNDYDLIVMGARGQREEDPYALGSVAKKVVRHTTCPTLIVKKVTRLESLLICIDGSEHSLQAFKYAANLAQKFGSKITLINVQEPRIYDYAPQTAKDLGEKILLKALELAGIEKVEVDKKVEFGIPSEKIVKVAERENHDLIVLGSRGLGTVKRFLLGSVSDYVSQKAKCSILIVPAKH
ncbi:MAG: universal stress protein [Candidatus Bathyarchaeia archaeon]